jgi:hypothetical protein
MKDIQSLSLLPVAAGRAALDSSVVQSNALSAEIPGQCPAAPPARPKGSDQYEVIASPAEKVAFCDKSLYLYGYKAVHPFFPDEKSNTLYVCSNDISGFGVAGPNDIKGAWLKTFDPSLNFVTETTGPKISSWKMRIPKRPLPCRERPGQARCRQR